jgi:hypothetical protein
LVGFYLAIEKPQPQEVRLLRVVQSEILSQICPSGGQSEGAIEDFRVVCENIWRALAERYELLHVINVEQTVCRRFSVWTEGNIVICK